MTSTSISEFEGVLLGPDDPGYEESANTHYAQGSPKLVARPANTAAVAAAVKYATAEGLEVSVRCGGHGTSGMSTNQGGLVIDLGALDSVDVDDATGRVRLGGGATWGPIAEALQPHGLAISSGDTVSVGVGGLTLGGGIGWMVRAWGLALDSLVEAEVVLADGSIMTANESDQPELFWALRGGGGNFGIVTTFTFQAHPLEGIVAGSIQVAPGAVAEVLKGVRDAMRAAPPELNVSFLDLPAFGPDMPAGIQLEVCWAGTDTAAAEAAVAPLLALPGVTGHEFAPKAYREILVENPGPPPGITIVDNNAFVPDLSDDVIDRLVEYHDSLGSGVLAVRFIQGALNRVDRDATAFAWRDTEALLVSAAFLPPGTPEGTEERLRAGFAALGDVLAGAYGNFMANAGGAERIYPPKTLKRLRALKKQVDPAGVFRGNQVIAP